MPTSLQIVKCQCDASLPYTVRFFNVVPDPQSTSPGEPPKFTRLPITVMKKDSSNYWVGVTGDVNITYSFNPVDPAHVIEKNRLSELYDVTELEYGKLNVYVDFDNYNENEWQTHNSSREQWASSIFTYDVIKPHSKNVLMAHVTGSDEDIRYARVSGEGTTLETPGGKSIVVYNGPCTMTSSQQTVEATGSDDEALIHLTGNVAFASLTGCVVMVVARNDI